jgi:pimeloyl-ACP methyl ester carboxylesterase
LPCQDRWVQLAAIDTGSGPPVILLHGQPGNAGDWQPVTERLRERMRVIAPDRPGYGRTGGRAGGFRDNAAAVGALLDRLGIESAVLAGHSWATGVALAAAIEFPERVRSLVLAAPVAPGVPLGRVDRALAHPRMGPAAVRLGFGVVGLGLALRPARSFARRAVPALKSSQVASTAAQWRTDDVWKSFYVEQRALVTELASLAPELPSLNKRAVVLCGTRDWITPPAHAIKLADVLPDAQLVSADRAGHMLPQQRPELMTKAIISVAA